MEPEILRHLILGAVPPGVAGLVLALLLARTPTETSAGGLGAGARHWRDVVWAPALFLIYVATHVLIFGRPEFPPARSIEAFPIVAFVGALLGVLLGVLRLRPVLTSILASVAVAACAWLSTRTLSTWWEGPERLTHLGLLGATVVLGALNVLGAEALIRRAGPRLGVAAVAIALGGIAQVLVLGFYSMALGQAAGVGAAAVSGALVALLLKRGKAIAAGAMAVPVLVAVVSIFQGVVFGDSARPLMFASLGACALPAGGLACVLVPRGARPGRRVLLVLAAVVLPLAGAVTVAALDWMEHEGEGGSEESVSLGIVQEIPSC